MRTLIDVAALNSRVVMEMKAVAVTLANKTGVKGAAPEEVKRIFSLSLLLCFFLYFSISLFYLSVSLSFFISPSLCLSISPFLSLSLSRSLPLCLSLCLSLFLFYFLSCSVNYIFVYLFICFSSCDPKSCKNIKLSILLLFL